MTVFRQVSSPPSPVVIPAYTAFADPTVEAAHDALTCAADRDVGELAGEFAVGASSEQESG